MAAKPHTVEPSELSPITTDTSGGAVRNARIAQAKAQQAASAPVSYMPIKRAGIGKLKKDGRRSGGCFSAKRLTIAEVDNLREVAPDQHEIIDRKACRFLLVPLHMEYTDYPTLQPNEVVMEEHEAVYATEDQRDFDLSKQVDPFWYPGKLFPGTKREMKTPSLGFGRFDPMWRNDEPGAGNAFGAGVMGRADKIQMA